VAGEACLRHGPAAAVGEKEEKKETKRRDAAKDFGFGLQYIKI
jgi:hypothetical protein